VYEDFYHLREKPFRLSPDPGFFFASRGHKRALAYLRYGLSQGEGFVVITGAPGTGKTTLAQILLQEMGQTDVVVAHLTTTQLEAEEMLRMVAASYGLRYEGQDKAGLLKTLEAFLMARAREHKRVLLVVDEAQNLPARSLEELRMLSNLQVGNKALLQTFLLGQVQFRQMLDDPDLEQLRQRVIANYHLSALAPDECQSYVESRLQQVSWQNDPQFTPEAYKIIHEYTEGVPRRINMLCDRVLLFSCLEERHVVDEKVLGEVTDELQSEISGRPIAPVELTDEQPADEAPQSVQPQGQSVATPPGDVSQAGKRSTKARKTKDSTKAARKTNGTEGAEATVTAEHHHVAAKVAEGLEAKKGRLKAAAVVNTEEPVMDEPVVADPDHSGMDRAVPDKGWNQSVAQVQPDAAELDEAAENKESKTSEKDRFRVIMGGKDSAKQGGADATPDRPANNPAPAVMAPIPDAPGDSQDVVLRKILRLVLAFHRSPRSFPGLDDPTQPLPKGIQQIIELAVSEDHVLAGLRQIAVMGVSPAMLRAAVRFFIRRVMFLPGGDDFRVLGLAPGASLADVELHYGLLMKLLRQDSETGEDSGVARIGESYERLCKSELIAEHQADNNKSDGNGEAEGELDLDLAPKLSGPGNVGFGVMQGRTDDIITSTGRTGSTARNIVLIAGAAVVVFILYLTQISTPGVTPTEVSISRENVAAAMVATKEASAPERKEEPAASAQETSGEPILGGSDAQVLLADEKDASTVINTEEDAQRAGRLALEEMRVKAEIEREEARQEAEAKAAAEAKLKAELEAEMKAEAQARAEAKAQREAQVKAEAKARREAQAKAKARAEADAKARAELKARQEAARQKKLAEVAAGEEAKRQQAARISKLQAQSPTPAVSASVATEKLSASVSPQGSQIGLAALNKIVLGFEAAYQAGDSTRLAAFLSPTVRTNDQTDRDGVKAQYKTLFENSSKRNFMLTKLSWQREDNYVKGIGEYKLSVTNKGDGSTFEETGKLTMQLENSSGKLLITRFYLVDAVRKTNSAENPSRHISAESLNRLLTAMAVAYEAGDIEQFMGVFANNAKTNDRATVSGIREDYVGLFANTTSRKIDFKNMKWRWDESTMRGEGKYEVVVLAKGKEQKDIYRGTLWMHVERHEGNPRITYFSFAE
jgi:TolA protein